MKARKSASAGEAGMSSADSKYTVSAPSHTCFSCGTIIADNRFHKTELSMVRMSPAYATVNNSSRLRYVYPLPGVNIPGTVLLLVDRIGTTGDLTSALLVMYIRMAETE